MIDEQTTQKLFDMRLRVMAEVFQKMLAEAPGHELSFADKVGMMVDREWTERENRKLARLLRAAKLSMDACLEDVFCSTERGISRAVVGDLSTCQWIENKHNVIVIGKTGVGKSFVAAALAQAACRNGYKALCTRVPRLVHELSIARADGSYTLALHKLAKLDVLVLDDFLIAPLKDIERRDLLEVLEDRYAKRSTVITAQIPTKQWHRALGDPTIADAICDRIVHNAHVLGLRGPSIREKKGLNAMEAKTNH
jgi:DNA replication protein DnaC